MSPVPRDPVTTIVERTGKKLRAVKVFMRRNLTGVRSGPLYALVHCRQLLSIKRQDR